MYPRPKMTLLERAKQFAPFELENGNRLDRGSAPGFRDLGGIFPGEALFEKRTSPGPPPEKLRAGRDIIMRT